MTPVVVVGGGLAGLVAAFRLVERGVNVVLIEQGTRLGGQIHTVRPEGICVELGAEGFVARSRAVPRLCADLGIEGSLIDQTTTVTSALAGGELVELAPGEAASLLGFQVPKEELGRGIRSLQGGMGELIDRLDVALSDRATLRRGETVLAVGATSEGPRVVVSDGGTIDARAVVLTVPSRIAADLLGPTFGESALGLARGRMTSNASATLLYETRQIGRALEGSGFIVPASDQRDGFRACSFVTIKLARPVPEGTTLLRAFFRPSAADAASSAEKRWIDLAAQHLGDALRISGPPLRGWESEWRNALPVYDDAYRSAVAAAEAAVGPASILFAGSHFHGAGIDAAVRSAERAAALVSGS